MEEWEKLAMSYGEQNKLCHSHSYFYYKGGMSKEWFAKGTELEFEGRKVLVPYNYDAYLTHVFGDYMKLPPVEARVGHSYLYVNYDRRISDKEAKGLFAQYHKSLEYRFSIKREIKYLLRLLKLIN